MRITTNKGFTLIDLLLTIGILSITFGIALPAMDDFIDRGKIKSESMQLRSSLQLARKTAISENKKVTVCPTKDAKDCDKDWSKGYMVFIDLNEDRQLDETDLLIYQSDIKDDRITLRWKAFGARSSMQWHQTGITNYQNGSFEFCFHEKPKLARALIVTKAGRIRPSKDNNGDGIHENSRGDNLSC